MAVDAQGRAWVGNFGFDLMTLEGKTVCAIGKIQRDHCRSACRNRTQDRCES